MAGDRLARRKLLKQYRRYALRRNYNFCLTYEQFEKLTLADCYFCGRKPNKTYSCNKDASWKGKKRTRRIFCIYNGIDRLDNTIGYEISNCAPCCWKCNDAKGRKSVSDFLSWARETHDWLDRIVKRKPMI